MSAQKKKRATPAQARRHAERVEARRAARAAREARKWYAARHAADKDVEDRDGILRRVARAVSKLFK